MSQTYKICAWLAYISNSMALQSHMLWISYPEIALIKLIMRSPFKSVLMFNVCWNSPTPHNKKIS